VQYLHQYLYIIRVTEFRLDFGSEPTK